MPISYHQAKAERVLLHQLLEEGFLIDSAGFICFRFVEDTPISDELAAKLKRIIRKNELSCPDYEV